MLILHQITVNSIYKLNINRKPRRVRTSDQPHRYTKRNGSNRTMPEQLKVFHLNKHTKSGNPQHYLPTLLDRS